jgi:hypothetical protein
VRFHQQTCYSGYGNIRTQFTGVVLAEDRHTVLAHIFTNGSLLYNVDTGEVRSKRTGDVVANSGPQYFFVEPQMLETLQWAIKQGCPAGNNLI